MFPVSPQEFHRDYSQVLLFFFSRCSLSTLQAVLHFFSICCGNSMSFSENSIHQGFQRVFFHEFVPKILKKFYGKNVREILFPPGIPPRVAQYFFFREFFQEFLLDFFWKFILGSSKSFSRISGVQRKWISGIIFRNSLERLPSGILKRISENVPISTEMLRKFPEMLLKAHLKEFPEDFRKKSPDR